MRGLPTYSPISEQQVVSWDVRCSVARHMSKPISTLARLSKNRLPVLETVGGGGIFSVGRPVRISICSLDDGESGARARLASRISSKVALQSVAPSMAQKGEEPLNTGCHSLKGLGAPGCHG